jgi:hypothetical protein
MSWKFGGAVIKKDYKGSFAELLEALQLPRKDARSAFDFSTATTEENRRTAAGVVNGRTLLLDRRLPYNCSYEENEMSQFDKTLAAFSNTADTLVFMLDGASDTYFFSFFAQGERKRRWSAEPGNILCNDGGPLEEELPFITGKAEGDEERKIAVFESVTGAQFNDLLDDQKTMYRLFI